jgi:ribosome-binding protein aMBF1 (putative translation factor)
MIKNEREYKITKAVLAKFSSALQHIANLKKEGGYDKTKLKLQQNAAQSMANELKQQLEEYEQLKKTRKLKSSMFDTVETIPSNLIRARIALGWTQKDLAKHLGTTEQQIQRYESTDYQSASLKKINKIVSILKIASDSASSTRSSRTA